MRREPGDDTLSSLLIRWHRWSADPMLSTDPLMREFDQIVAGLWSTWCAVLIFEARNLACGAVVWSSGRVRYSRELRVRAWRGLQRALAQSNRNWHEVISYNERGNRIGESNPMARLTDHEVDLIRELYEERNPDGTRRWTFGQIALRTKQPKSTVSDICYGRRRAQIVSKVKEG